PVLVSLLARATHVGVGWGKMVASAISAIRTGLIEPARRPDDPLVCVATVGGMVGEPAVRPETRSSLLAAELAGAMNGSPGHLHTLHGVEAFIASYLDDPNEVDLVRRRISRFVNYEVIFGRPGHAAMIHQVDAIVTSCGHAHHR